MTMTARVDEDKDVLKVSVEGVDLESLGLDEDDLPLVKAAQARADSPTPKAAATDKTIEPEISDEARRIIAAAARIRASAPKGAFTPSPISAERRQDVLKRAEEAADVPAMAAVILDETENRTTEAVRKALMEQYQESVVKAETAFIRDGHADYTDRLIKAGIFEGVKVDQRTGQRANPELQVIYDADDPRTQVSTAYRLATEILVARGDLKVEALDEFRSKPQAQTPPGIVLDERPIHEPQRPRSINQVPSAGDARTMTLSREALDELRDSRPEAYMRLIEKQPSIRTYHLGG